MGSDTPTVVLDPDVAQQRRLREVLDRIGIPRRQPRTTQEDLDELKTPAE